MLPRQLKEIEFGQGLSTKGDRRAQPEQLLDIATNVEFDDIGGLRVRYPFDNVRTALVGGGTLTNARKFTMLGDQLLCFTIDSLYSWSAAELGWVKVGTHVAAEISESARFQRPADQVQCDRAQLGNVIVYTWAENNQVYASASDAVTGAVIAPATAINAVNTLANSPRVVALQTRILLFGLLAGSTQLLAIAIDPANVAAGFASAPVLMESYGGAVVGGTYDVLQVPGTDTALLAAAKTTAGNPTYDLIVINSALVSVAASAKLRVANAIAVAINPTGTRIQVIRLDGSPAIKGDLINAATLADITINQAIGAAAGPTSIAAAYQSVQQGGQYRCFAFWTTTTPAAAPVTLEANWVDDAGTIGAATAIGFDLTPVSRAFDVSGRVFVWTVFGLSSAPNNLENTMFLYRDDGFLSAKALDGIAGGLLPTLTAGAAPVGIVTPLPGVQTIAGVNMMCATERRIVPLTATLGGARGAYSARCPRDLGVRLDSNNARRCARFGDSLYIAAGEVLAYDGAQLVEAGWHLYPWFLAAAKHVGGVIPNGNYAYEATGKWTNAAGEIDRSTSGVPVLFTMAGGPAAVDLLIRSLYPTHKTAPPAAIEVWRTQVNPTIDSPLFLATSIDPTATTGNNPYLVNGAGASANLAIVDNMLDATIATNQANPENDGSLEDLAPPPATIIYASDTRLFLAGIAGFPNQVWYSKQRTVGNVAAFNDALTIDVPTDGGAITAIGVLDGALVVWCETATYQYAGGGFDNAQGGSNFQLARVVSSDLGCVGPEGCALTDDGFFVKTGKGWAVLDRSLNYTYVGGGVDKYDPEPVLAIIVLTARHQVRILTSARMLAFDTLVKQWAEFSVADGLDMLLWNGAPAYLTATGVRAELATWAGYAGTDYTLTEADIETSWIKFGGMQGRAIVDFVQLLGELRSTCVIRKRLAKDYEATAPGAWNYNTDVTWTPTGIDGSALQVRQSPRRKRVESFKARFTITHPDGVSPLGGPCVRMTSIALQYALEPNAYGALGSAQKQ